MKKMKWSRGSLAAKLQIKMSVFQTGVYTRKRIEAKNNCGITSNSLTHTHTYTRGLVYRKRLKFNMQRETSFIFNRLRGYRVVRRIEDL